MIKEISPHDVISYGRSVLGLTSVEEGIDDVFLGGMLRRAAGIYCPCSRTTLRVALVESLAYLDGEIEVLSDRLDLLIEELIVAGDLLELSDVTTGDIEARGTWVFAAPPAFIVRRSGIVFLTGIVPDQDNFLPEALSTRVIHTDITRSIVPDPDEDLTETLLSEGLNMLSETLWLKSPRSQPASQLRAKAMKKLEAQPRCGPVAGLEIIEPETKVTFYRGRWSTPKGQSGCFVARRPQEFGAPIWCFAELNEGLLVRIIDLPLGAYRWRGCDAAWHLQMAIDHELGHPQAYRLRDSVDGNSRLDFYSPLPLWAERRLMVLGRKCAGEKSLFSYELPMAEAAQEVEFLRENLWLTSLDVQANERSE